MDMKAQLIRIGNSQGIRIPKALLEQCHFEKSVELEVHDGVLIVRPVHDARAGWAEKFREMAERGDDALPDAGSVSLTDWDNTEWNW
jgi:antitoxin MazE